MASRFLGSFLVCLFAFFCAASHAGNAGNFSAQVASDVIPGSHTFSPGEEFEFIVHATTFEGDAVFGSDPFAILGTNAGDFEILSENCSSIAIFGNGGSCTVRVRYNGSGQTAGDNEFRVTCSTAAAGAFGPAVVCDGVQGTLLNLFARVAAVAIPLMTPLGTTLLALLMLGFFFFHGLRRTR